MVLKKVVQLTFCHKAGISHQTPPHLQRCFLFFSKFHFHYSYIFVPFKNFKYMDQLTLGIGTRLQHTRWGQGVIVGVRYATYLISFIEYGTKEIEKNDAELDEIIPENVSEEIETNSDKEKSLLRILKMWGGITEKVPLGDRWEKGTMILQPFDKTLKPKEIPIEDFFHKIVMLRDRLRVLEQNINSNKKLSEEDKVNMQQYITRCYGSLTTFNILFKNKEQHFVGDKSSGE